MYRRISRISFEPSKDLYESLSEEVEQIEDFAMAPSGVQQAVLLNSFDSVLREQVMGETHVTSTIASQRSPFKCGKGEIRLTTTESHAVLKLEEEM